jgi:hypothetical protein
MDGKNSATAIPLKISSQNGALIASKHNSLAHKGNVEGMIAGAAKLLKMKAGNADAMPASNHDSASLLFVGKPNDCVEVPHQASTGKENPINHNGIAMITNNNTPKNSAN